MAGKIQYIRDLEPHACTYWPGQDITAHFQALAGLNFKGPIPVGIKAAELLRPAHIDGVKKGFLSAHFGTIAPVCPTCRACVPLRVSTEKFSLSPSQQAVMDKKHFSYSLALTQDANPHELHGVFKSYIQARHNEKESGMRQWKHIKFREWLDHMPFIITKRNQSGSLVGFAAINGDKDCSIMEYLAFDPAYAKHSPGKYLWLATVSIMKEAGVPHVYVGSWAKGSPKLQYKEQHSGLETFDGKNWVDFDPAVHTQGPDYKAMIRREGFTV